MVAAFTITTIPYLIEQPRRDSFTEGGICFLLKPSI